MGSREAFMLYACPALGALVAFCMFVSPLRAVLKVDRSKHLGEINPLPFIFMVANGMGWLAYGLYIHDFFVFCSNIAAVLLGLFYVMTCSKYCKEQTQDCLRNILLAVCVVFIVVALVFMGTNLGPRGDRLLWGVLANAILAVYYIAPLSSLAKVLSARDSSSLHRPMLIANVANGLLWFAYGLAIHDLLLIIPNAFGAGFSLLSLAISLMFPARANKLAANNPTSGPTSPASSQGGDSFAVERSASKPLARLAQMYGGLAAFRKDAANGAGSSGGGTETAAAAAASGADAPANTLTVLPLLPVLPVNRRYNGSDAGSGDADVEAAIFGATENAHHYVKGSRL